MTCSGQRFYSSSHSWTLHLSSHCTWNSVWSPVVFLLHGNKKRNADWIKMCRVSEPRESPDGFQRGFWVRKTMRKQKHVGTCGNMWAAHLNSINPSAGKQWITSEPNVCDDELVEERKRKRKTEWQIDPTVTFVMLCHRSGRCSNKMSNHTSSKNTIKRNEEKKRDR